MVACLEVMIVFGWCAPILVALYLCTFYGFIKVYPLIMVQQHVSLISYKPIFGYLWLSLFTQQFLALCFFHFTQSPALGNGCLAVSCLNIILIIYSVLI